MLYNKKEPAAGPARDKLIAIVEYCKECNLLNQRLAKESESDYCCQCQCIQFPYFDKLDDYNKNRYFTDREKNLIIDYLIDCMANDEPFDCSTMGPNEYLEEYDKFDATVSDTKL